MVDGVTNVGMKLRGLRREVERERGYSSETRRGSAEREGSP